MSMSFEDIRQSLYGLLAQWGEHPIEYDDIKSSAVDGARQSGDPWLRATILPGDSFTAYIGDGPKARDPGVLALQIFVKPPAVITVDDLPASIQAYRIASSLAEHVSYYQDGWLETRAASLRRVGEQDGYYQMNVTTVFVAN
ncbi:phage tail terminator-like protein [Modicisalibacter coralii]|uniref:phage tail terminator-like protein n=1 Tax=Modicisalibacter coralii TaxID=2304602 RepID=UPI00100B316E|nr:phage tail terminator-like protein [Halomonas coralii]